MSVIFDSRSRRAIYEHYPKSRTIRRQLNLACFRSGKDMQNACDNVLVMGLIGGGLARAYLNTRIWPEDDTVPTAYQDKSKLEVLFGPRIWEELAGKMVLDFGCGRGHEAVEIASRGAPYVMGLDIRPELLQSARESARAAGVEATCRFAASTHERFDVVLSLDSMEHFNDPARVLESMASLLRSSGYVLMSFGPPWLHPLGHHFPLFPWAHLIFTESAMMQWRARWKKDGAARFHECAGGLNQMTIRKFERLVAQSRLRFASVEMVPIRRLRVVHNRMTREFTTAVVKCRLVLRNQACTG